MHISGLSQPSPYHPVLSRSASSTAPCLRFAGNPQVSTTSTQKPKSAFEKLTQWLSNLFTRIGQWFSAWFTSKNPSTTKSATNAQEPEIISRVDPKLKTDPYERNRVAYAIADEAFPELVRLYQEKPVEVRGNTHIYWQNLAQETLNRAIQKHLHTKAKTFIHFLEGGGIARGMVGFPERTASQTQRKSLGDLSVFHPSSYTYDLSQEKDRQDAYISLVHEIRHLVKGYAFDICDKENLTLDPNPADPLKSLYGESLTIMERSGCPILQHILNDQNPHLKPFETLSTPLKENFPLDTLQQYGPALRQLWARKDYPLLDPEYYDKEKITKLFRDGDPKVVDSYIEHRVIEELESYMTAIKRAPGIPTNKLQPSDIDQLGRAMILRDLLRYYYEIRQIPKNQQHPFAEVKSLKLIA